MFLYPWQELEDQNSDRTLLNYFTLGRAIFNGLEQIVRWHFGEFSQIDRFLDFACGYGRLTRFLIQALSPEKIWVSDIYREAVEFQAAYFGVQGFHSASQPENYHLNQTFDCILAGSFFSHMPERTFTPWMQTLYELLTPGGILIFSVLGEEILPAHVSMPSTGILFSSDTSESQSLDKEDYGTTYVTEAFVRRVVEQVSQGQASVVKIPRGMCHYQDFYVISPSYLQGAQTLNFHHQPEGYLDSCTVDLTGTIHLRGWAVDFNPQGQIEQVEIWSQGQQMTQTHPTEPRPDLREHFGNPNLPLDAGWSCIISLKRLSPEAIVLIRIVNTAGLASIIAAMPIKTLMARQRILNELSRSQNNVQQTQAQLSATHEKLAYLQGHLDHAQQTLEQSRHKLLTTEQRLGATQAQLLATEAALAQTQNQVQAMASSKFWKLRTKWFKLRRAMGLSDNEPI
ncbi:MAG: methyltransferase [Oscillatoriales cyanobacterium RM1_1_9]|nr:methyltransferase [Oscillatoriales cyanobacterium RM1_1_9]